MGIPMLERARRAMERDYVPRVVFWSTLHTLRISYWRPLKSYKVNVAFKS